MADYLSSKSTTSDSSTGSSSTLKGLVGLEKSREEVVPVLLEEVFGKFEEISSSMSNSLPLLIFSLLTLSFPRYKTTDGNAGEAAQRVADGIPIGRPPTIELRNQHATYAATWLVS